MYIPCLSHPGVLNIQIYCCVSRHDSHSGKTKALFCVQNRLNYSRHCIVAIRLCRSRLTIPFSPSLVQVWFLCSEGQGVAARPRSHRVHSTAVSLSCPLRPAERCSLCETRLGLPPVQTCSGVYLAVYQEVAPLGRNHQVCLLLSSLQTLAKHTHTHSLQSQGYCHTQPIGVESYPLSSIPVKGMA